MKKYRKIYNAMTGLLFITHLSCTGIMSVQAAEQSPANITDIITDTDPADDTIDNTSGTNTYSITDTNSILPICLETDNTRINMQDTYAMSQYDCLMAYENMDCTTNETAAYNGAEKNTINDDAISGTYDDIPKDKTLYKLYQSGVHYGPSGRETYYNLPMENIVSHMRRRGYDEMQYPYWIREDGIHMLGGYVMVAADLSSRPRGTILETSVGMAIVCDTGSFVAKYPDGIDIATNW